MSGFLYFLPGLHGADPDGIRALGLADALRDCGGARECAPGPSGSQGVVIGGGVSPEGRAAELGYWPERQEWRACDQGKWWLGWEKESPPGPRDLRRAQVLVSHPVRMEDGEQWLVPVARDFAAGSPLPKRLVLSADGREIEEELPRFAEFSRRAEAVFYWFCRANGLGAEAFERGGLAVPEALRGDAPEVPADRLGTAAMALGLNYRLGRWELGALGLLSTESAKAVERAIIDWPTVERIQAGLTEAESKKKASSASNGSGSGAGAGGS